jgi:hypothetical protein
MLCLQVDGGDDASGLARERLVSVARCRGH